MKFYCSDKFSHQYWQWNSYLIGNYALNMLMNVKACNIEAERNEIVARVCWK